MTHASRRLPVSRMVRVFATVGLSAVAAVAAHAGPAGLKHASWLGAATAGGLIAIAALLLAAYATVRLRLDARRVAWGSAPAGTDWVIDQPSFPSLVAVMLVCQASAHLALVATGVAPSGGEIASPALHIVLAIAAATLVWLVGWFLNHAHGLLQRAVAAAVERLLAGAHRAPARPVQESRRGLPRAGAVHGRAPPMGKPLGAAAAL